MANLKNYGIILASGTGSRCGAEIPKQFLKIAGKTILEYSIEAFEFASEIDEIILVITPDYRDLVEEILLKNNYTKIGKLLNGGETRKDSSYIGISSIEDKEANVLIHDCARPLLSQRIIKDCIEALKTHDAINVVVPVTDTIIEVENGIIKKVPERSKLMRAQTPQCFKLSIIRKAHEYSKEDNNFTDDCSLVMKYNLADVYVVEGDENNIKITYPNDLLLAESLIKNKE